MKRMWIALFLIVVVLVTSTLCLFLLTKIQREMDTRLTGLYELSLSSDAVKTAEAARELTSLWQKRLTVLCRIVRHTQLDQVTLAIARLEPLALYGEEGELAAEILRCRILLNEIRDAELPFLRNIF